MSLSADDTRALRDATRGLLAAVTPDTANAHVAATTAEPDRGVWRRLAVDLGLLGVRVPEDLGGVGLDLAQEILVHEEMGRALHGGPFLPVVGQVLPALLPLRVDERVAALVDPVVAGELVIVPAYTGWYTAAEVPTVDESGAGPRVTGVVPSVLECRGADRLLVVAESVTGSGSEPVLLLVDAREPGVEIHALEGVDLTRRFADVRLADAPAVVLARGQAARDATARLETGAALALCADSVGLASAAFEMTVDYLKVREQFGRVIGGFQALKHQAADALVLLESARSALAFAVEAQAGDDARLRSAALAVARRRCGTAAFAITNAAIHLHGGIGFTWEHRVHLFHRRAKANEVLLDWRGRQADRLAADVMDLLGDPAPRRA